MKYSRWLAAIVIALILTPTANAQHRRSITVKAGDDVAKAYSPNGFYRFAQFSNAALFSKSRKGSSGMPFNYNILDDKMQYIDKKGDTLEMINPTIFDSLVIENTVFYYRETEGFFELIATAWPLRLVRKTTVKMKTETVGAYGGGTGTSAIDRMKTYVVGTNVYTYKSNENMIIKEMVDWYWMGENGVPAKATKRNLLTIIPRDKVQFAENYISENKLDFDEEKDLVKLVIALRN